MAPSSICHGTANLAIENEVLGNAFNNANIYKLLLLPLLSIMIARQARKFPQTRKIAYSCNPIQ
jgi:hypothetical protein